ncbi:MAG: hypothetical protein WCR42_06885 [bacterium]
MKKIIILLILISFSYNISYASNNNKIKIEYYYSNNIKELEEFAINRTNSRNVLKTPKTIPSYEEPKTLLPDVNKNDKVLIMFKDQDSNYLMLGDIILSSFYVHVPAQNKYKPERPDYNPTNKYYILELKDLESENGLELTFYVEISNSAYELTNPKGYAYYYKCLSPYKSFNNNLPICWFPVTLFATNFKSDSTGIPFNAIPIGIAIGGKIGVTKYNYLGISGIANLLITKNNETSYLQTMTLGMLFDFDGILYLGSTYGINFIDRTKDTKWMFVVGFGPELLQFLSSKE